MLSQLIGPRIRDRSTEGFRQWPFMSVHFWGENPKGTWKVHVDQVKGTNKSVEFKSVVHSLSLVLLGTKEIPEHAKTPRKYEGFPATRPQGAPSSFSPNEMEVETADIERTIENARTALLRRSPAVEQKLVEVDELVRKLRSLNERRRFPRSVQTFG
ncbi:PHOMO B domain-containing protein [Aphelenchoides fujianensis]|nr:PHOMO B domain-containing protein [Aphelenchoides fujianensis]